ncbi:alpha/beta hydrolase [Paenibacillus sp. 481]|uniref:alpha/beta hydrolase n=1 Tax=Paenibacillus sp. 481 TaxID=2835869 RepID=UPI001E53ED81|nr:alpha/beta hydrolase family protein [Paenibacillus sp. 481]UHA72383.1 esterase family protein [Paenibacillus sp. 481]
MALIECRFYSETLKMNTQLTAIIPERLHNQHRTLYLLHGMSDDDTAWVRNSSIERAVSGLGLAVIMPQVHRSFYTDMAYGGKYWTFLSEELPRLAHAFFPLSDKREHNYVAGLSMGGYGAMKWALTYPERFAACASLSGALDVAHPFHKELWGAEYVHIFGEQPVAGSGNDLLHLLRQCDATEGQKPLLYQCCGTEDFLLRDNHAFRDVCQGTSMELTYEESSGGHTWDYWDQQIQRVLRWLPK